MSAAETLSADVRSKDSRSEVWRRYARSGHGSALENTLVEQHLPLVKTVVGRLAMTLPAHVNPDDLYSAGLVGLLNALRRYDPKGGSTFESYARVRIRGAILDELRRLDWVPRSVHAKAGRVEKIMNELAQTSGRMPDETAMAKALGLSLDEYGELLDEIRPATFVCLDSVTNHDGEPGGKAHEIMADESQTDPGHGTSSRELASLMAERIHQLPEIQQKVLALYYFEDMRLREIAEAFGLTESRICQIHGQAILALKALLRKADPEAFSESSPV